MSISSLTKACAAMTILLAFVRGVLGCPSSAVLFWLALVSAAIASGPDDRSPAAAGRRYM